MKEYSRVELESSRPPLDGIVAIDFCLDALYADREHRISDPVVGGLSFEELIGALLLAKGQWRERP